MTEIPSYLETPSKSRVNPPTQTLVQELPFGELTWEDFEKLCLRLARQEANVETCRLYGVRGDAQEGIDIYARRRLEDGYRVYQCKRVEDFQPADIRKAVQTFLDGEWAIKTKHFYLCTQDDLRNKPRTDEIECQRIILNEKGIEFTPWDGHELSMLLKVHPKLVDDFFGRGWVECFCGPEAARQLGNRLDNCLVGEFRNKLQIFYQRIFNIHDPGLPGAHDVGLLPLEKRFVVPDVNEERISDISVREESSRRDRSDSQISTIENRTDKSGREPDNQKHTVRSMSHRLRLPVDEWLASDDRHIILGGPGSGKSTLLRFIAVDLLDESPRLPKLAGKRGEYLPVWISFAYWTKRIANNNTSECNLSEALRDWLKSLNEERLWPLVERALEDERLLLLVDGLDEWANESAAQIALDRLNVFIEQRGVPAIFTSRPHGFARLGFPHNGWRIGELADFTIEQQRELAHHWFNNQEIHLRRDVTIDDEELARTVEHDLDGFFGEMQRAKDIHDLAKTPLLLCLLIVLKFQNARLPQSRFKAYEQLIEHLVSTHPRRRNTAAGLTEASIPVDDDDVKKALAHLALQIHLHHVEGIIELDSAHEILEDFLRDDERGLGITFRESQKLSRQIIDVSEQALGLIVERSPREVGFYHRTFQEFLAALSVYSMPIDDQLLLIGKQCGNPQWREPILALCHINRRPEDVRRYVEQIINSPLSAYDHNQRDLLLAEIAFGDFNCPAKLARELAERTFILIEQGTWMPQRERLLTQVLNGLMSTRVKEHVKAKIRRWVPGSSNWTRKGVFEAMAKWPKDQEVIDGLWNGLFDEHLNVQRAAAISLATLAYGDIEIGDKISKLAQTAPDSLIRACAIEALLTGWSDHTTMQAVLQQARSAGCQELRLMAIKGAIQLSTQTNDDVQELLLLANNDDGLGYQWRKDIIDALITGWPGNTDIKASCIKAVKYQLYEEGMLDRDIAMTILIDGYPGDHDFAQILAKLLSGNNRSFLLRHDIDLWRSMCRNYRDNPELINAFDSWIPQQQDHINDSEITQAALIGRTSIGKNALLTMLDKSNFVFRPAGALLEGWGMEDSAVSTALTRIAFGPEDIASTLGEHLPQIISDINTCKTRLLEILRSPLCNRYDFVLRGLIALNAHNEPEVLDSILARLEQKEISGHLSESIELQIIQLFPTDSRVQKLAKEQLTNRSGNLEVVATAFGNDAEISNIILPKINPLPSRLRVLIYDFMGEFYGEDEYILCLLKDYDLEDDDEARTCASIAYHTRLKESGGDIVADVSRLSETIKCVGHDYEQRRRAAMCGLIVLDRLDIYSATKEANMNSEYSKFSFVRHIYSNARWLRFIAKHYEQLQSAFEKNLFQTFWESDTEIWDTFFEYAHEYPSVSRDAIGFIEQHHDKYSPAAIQFLAKARPKSSQLLDCCLKSMQASGTHSIHDFIAPEIIGSQFGGDNEVLARVLSLNNHLFDGQLITALCEGWPDSPKLDEIFDIARTNQSQMSYPPYFQLICAKSTSSLVFDRVIENISDNQRWTSQMITRPVLRRLKADDELFNMFKDKLLRDANASEKASIPKLIDSARGLTSELREWCVSEIESQLNGSNPPEIGKDIFVGDLRPVVHSLYDVLN